MFSHFLRQVQLLEGPDRPLVRQDVVLRDGTIAAFGEGAVALAAELDLPELMAQSWLLAPALVDPHSELEDPFTGRAETLTSLVTSAAAAGYGTVALLPRARSWRDRPERLQLVAPAPFQLLLWGSFSSGGRGEELAPHADQLASGALGLAEDGDLPALALLERGLRLAEGADAPLLLAPRDPSLTQRGFVREGVEALRAGWPLDPAVSETLPLQSLLSLTAELGPATRFLRLMNLSTAAGIELLRQSPSPPEATVGWWHLLADSGGLDPVAEGWHVKPSLGSPTDREALIAGLAEGLVTAVAVNHQALDAEEQLLPVDQRQPGVAGHRFVLPGLWQELVVRRGWSVEALWGALSWGPSRLLGRPPLHLELGSRQWLLFDPDQQWDPAQDPHAPLAANQPLAAQCQTGQVLASGLMASLWRGPRC
jgi:dihydroorotase